MDRLTHFMSRGSTLMPLVCFGWGPKPVSGGLDVAGPRLAWLSWPLEVQLPVGINLDEALHPK